MVRMLPMGYLLVREKQCLHRDLEQGSIGCEIVSNETVEIWGSLYPYAWRESRIARPVRKVAFLRQ